MTLRITGGKFRGTKITSPKSVARPTSSIMREALFNIISFRIEDSYFLDLFAGSGIMGIEALSRGAKKTIFVEKSKANAGIIKKNINMLKMENFSDVICNDALKAIGLLNIKFNIIYIDPPYAESHILLPKTLNKLESAKIIDSNSDIFVETNSKFSIDLLKIKNFDLVKSKKYGNSALHHFKYFF